MMSQDLQTYTTMTALGNSAYSPVDDKYISMSDASEAARLASLVNGVGEPLYDDQTDMSGILEDLGLSEPVEFPNKG
jgi:hypothetical protein